MKHCFLSRDTVMSVDFMRILNAAEQNVKNSYAPRELFSRSDGFTRKLNFHNVNLITSLNFKVNSS